jgi:tRNA modification GTPase
MDPRPRVLLLGRPNAGKSSLMNRLSGTDRSLCSPEPGTTRDILSAPVSFPTGEAVLLDAAGIDATDDELLERAGALARGAAERVDLICLVADVTALHSPGDVDHHIGSLLAGLDPRRVIIALNKVDACDAAAAEAVRDGIVAPMREAASLVSAKSGYGVEELRDRIARGLARRDTSVSAEAWGLSDRQRRAIRDAEDAMLRSIDLAAGATNTLDVADTLAFELRDALSQLGCVTGDVATEELLGRVFAKFCIGK